MSKAGHLFAVALALASCGKDASSGQTAFDAGSASDADQPGDANPSEIGVDGSAAPPLEACSIPDDKQGLFSSTTGFLVSGSVQTYRGMGSIDMVDAKRAQIRVGTAGAVVKIEATAGRLFPATVGDSVTVDYWSNFPNEDSSLVLLDSSGRILFAHHDKNINADGFVEINSTPQLRVKPQRTCRLMDACFGLVAMLDIAVTIGKQEFTLPFFEKKAVEESGLRYEVANVYSQEKQDYHASPACVMSHVNLGPYTHWTLVRLP